MNIQVFKERIEELLEDEGIAVYYASAGDRNSDLLIERDRFLMITPIQSIPLGAQESCYVDINPQMRLYWRTTPNTENFRDMTAHTDMMASAEKIYDRIQDSDDILIKAAKRDISATWRRSDSSDSAYWESVLSFTLPLRVSGKKYFEYE